jgi:hypothetical protein
MKRIVMKHAVLGSLAAVAIVTGGAAQAHMDGMGHTTNVYAYCTKDGNGKWWGQGKVTMTQNNGMNHQLKAQLWSLVNNKQMQSKVSAWGTSVSMMGGKFELKTSPKHFDAKASSWWKQGMMGGQHMAANNIMMGCNGQ